MWGDRRIRTVAAMTTTTVSVQETRVERPMTRREEVAFAFFSTWSIIGLFVDGWAHNHDKPETFFTPWHGILYSGVGAAIAFAVFERRRAPVGTPPVAGERVTTAGLGVFLTGAVGDLVWHELFGIEVGIEALMSATHLLLMIGGVLAASAPLRAAWATDDRPRRGLREFAPVLTSATLSTALVAFFFMYATVFALGFGQPAPGDAGDLVRAHAILTAIVTSVLLVAPLAVLRARWTPPLGSATVLFSAIALALSGLRSFELLPLVGGAVVAGAVADAALARRLPLSAAAAASMAALWCSVFAVHAVVWGMPLTVHVWSGAVVFAVLAGAGLARLSELRQPMW